MCDAADEPRSPPQGAGRAASAATPAMPVTSRSDGDDGPAHHRHSAGPRQLSSAVTQRSPAIRRGGRGHPASRRETRHASTTQRSRRPGRGGRGTAASRRETRHASTTQRPPTPPRLDSLKTASGFGWTGQSTVRCPTRGMRLATGPGKPLGEGAARQRQLSIDRCCDRGRARTDSRHRDVSPRGSRPASNARTAMPTSTTVHCRSETTASAAEKPATATVHRRSQRCARRGVGCRHGAPCGARCSRWAAGEGRWRRG